MLSTVVLYGMTKWGDLFNSRQKLALITLLDKVRESYHEMLTDGYDDVYKSGEHLFGVDD